jgi:hypothetical protein
MKQGKRIDEDQPVGPLRVIPDFLPPPEQLVIPTDRVKVTLFLDRSSVDFFKTRAKRARTKYQQMMREVLRRYAHHHSSQEAA